MGLDRASTPEGSGTVIASTWPCSSAARVFGTSMNSSLEESPPLASTRARASTHGWLLICGRPIEWPSRSWMDLMSLSARTKRLPNPRPSSVSGAVVTPAGATITSGTCWLRATAGVTTSMSAMSIDPPIICGTMAAAFGPGVSSTLMPASSKNPPLSATRAPRAFRLGKTVSLIALSDSAAALPPAADPDAPQPVRASAPTVNSAAKRRRERKESFMWCSYW